MPIDLLPAFVMAVLACWLGLSLLVRAPNDYPTRVFAWLCLHLTFYGLTSVLPYFTAPDANAVRLTMDRIQIVETVLLPPVFLHFTMALVDLRPWLRSWRACLVLFYAIGLAMAGFALFSPAMLLTAPAPRFPDGPLIMLWSAQRVLPLLLALLLLVMSYRSAGADDLERRQRAVFMLSAMIGFLGTLWAIVAREQHYSPAFGHGLIDVALALLAYAVLAYRSLLPARVVQRTFYRSIIGGVITALYIGLLLVLERVTSEALKIDGPLVTMFTLVALIALFGPLRDWAGAWLDRRFFHREFDYGRLLRALGDDLFERGDLAGQLQTALAAICRTLGVREGAVAVQESQGLHVLAAYGVERPGEDAFRGATLPESTQIRTADWTHWPAARLLLPLRRGQLALGLLALGAKRSGEPYRETERALLESLSSYLALAIKHDRSQQEEQMAMAALAEQSRQLREEQELLVLQAAEAARLVAQPKGDPADTAYDLRVFVLGPLRVERGGKPIERWGGDKAGTYQAEALFAFLFDRRGRGLTKDEAEEVIWQTLELDKADTAFHRTISALRRTLEPGLRRGNESHLITYHHERYWLDPAAIGWCDADAFASATEQAHTLMRQGRLEEARECFTRAVGLYRGDYMDDCPFFGDSSYVEGRRADLRSQQLDALLALGAIYERLGQAGEAATCYRRAIATSADECPRAEEGLARLQVGIV